ncbi:aminopeptidase [Candidatus Dojkabacteria bacterium]|uniref:Aminopeptidase n=1 Tax=Candidatus Dojkabacteria bacterium TaxID=2099670 RepID=A0A955RII2_9BACT|nr:aminopeptidase [Candidatus Dojkabacteria bacterium]
MDKRATKLAQIIVDHSVKVKKGDNVVLTSSDFTGQDLITECYRLCLEKGANVYLDIFGTNFEIGRADFSDLYKLFISTASKKQLTTQPEIMKKIVDWGDKFIRITSIHNPNFLDPVDKKKLSLWQNTFYPLFNELVKKDWLLTYFPTEGTAANAGMSLEDFTDYYYNASIVDYAKMDKEIKPLQDIMDKGKTVSIIAEGTNLKFSIAGRLSAGVGSGKRNIPDGECYIAPIEDTAEGYITFFNPQIDRGTEVDGIYLEFSKGKVVNYKASKNKAHLDAVFSAHAGNKRLGEFGIGMNHNIQQYIKQIIYDEKIAGTIHLALGKSHFHKRGGGDNKGTIHWDMIKDLRHKGSIVMIDDVEIIKDGKVLV